jgi:CHAD domain-containing protein
MATASAMVALPERHDLLRKRLERFTRLLPAVQDGDVTALHRTRVASRRLRELLPVLQLDSALTAKLSRRLRKVRTRLGTVRDLDVLLILIDELHESRRHDRPALKRVADEVRRERARACEKLLDKKLPVGELKAIARKLERALDQVKEADAKLAAGRAPARGWKWALEARIARRAVSLREALDAAGAVYLPDRLHMARIAVKKLRYALELSNEAHGLSNTPELRVLKRAQELLGRINDLDVLVKRIRQAQASLHPPNIATWREYDTLTTSIENSCRRLHGRYMLERPALEAAIEQLIAKSPRPSARSRRPEQARGAVDGRTVSRATRRAL